MIAFPKIKEAITQLSGGAPEDIQRIQMTGHSLGGALAAIGRARSLTDAGVMCECLLGHFLSAWFHEGNMAKLRKAHWTVPATFMQKNKNLFLWLPDTRKIRTPVDGKVQGTIGRYGNTPNCSQAGPKQYTL